MPRQKMRQPRYRYITSDTVIGTDAVSDYQLISGTKINAETSGETVIRVKLPRDLKINKDYNQPFSTTDDTRTLDELGYDIMAYNANRKMWKVMNQYKGIRPCDIDVVRDHPKFETA